MAAAATPHENRQFVISPASGVMADSEAFHRAKLFYTIPEAIHALGVKQTTIYDLFAAGKLRRVKLGARTLIPAESLREFVASLVEPEQRAA